MDRFTTNDHYDPSNTSLRIVSVDNFLTKIRHLSTLVHATLGIPAQPLLFGGRADSQDRMDRQDV